MQIVGSEGYEGEVNAIDRRTADSAAIQYGTDAYMKFMEPKKLADRISSFKVMFPDMPAAAYMFLASSPTTNLDMLGSFVPAMQRLHAQRQEQRDRWDNGSGFLGIAGDIWHGVIPTAWDAGYDTMKGAARWGIAAGMFGLQVGTGLVGAAAGALDSLPGEVPFLGKWDDKDLRGMWRNPLATTDLGQMFANPLNTGSGFVPGGLAHERALSAQNDALQIRDPSGDWHSNSIGRFAMHVVGKDNPVADSLAFATNVTDHRWWIQARAEGRGAYTAFLGPKSHDTHAWESAQQKTWDLGSGAIDAYVAMRLDPAIYAGNVMRSASIARRTFRAAQGAEDLGKMAGLINGYRRIIHGPTVEKFLSSKRGSQLVSVLTKMTDPMAIGVAFGKRVDPRVLGEMARTTDPVEMRNLLSKALNVEIPLAPRGNTFWHPFTGDLGKAQRYQNLVDDAIANSGKVPKRAIGESGLALASDYGSWKARIKRNYKGEALRWKTRMGVGTVWANNPHQAMEELTAFFDAAKVSYADRRPVYDILGNWEHSGHTYNATTLAADIVKESLLARNLPKMPIDQAAEYEKALDEMFTLWQHSIDDTGIYWLDQLGKPLSEQAVVIDGFADTTFGPIPGFKQQAKIGDGPIAASQILSSSIVLPDARALRQQASMLQGMVGRISLKEIYKGGNTFRNIYNPWEHYFLQPLTMANKWWKANVLLRIGAMVRNVGEAQASMAANGSVSLFRHPDEFMALIVGANRKNLALAMEDFSGKSWNKILADVTKKHYFQGVTPQSARAAAETRGIYLSSGFVTADRVSEHYASAWVDEILRTHDDDVLRSLAQALRGKEQYAKALDANDAMRMVRDEFWDGELADARKVLLTRGHPKELDPTEFTAINGTTVESTSRVGDLLGERAWADGYLDQVLLDKWLHTISAKDDDLLEAIATGDFGGYSLNRRYKPIKDDSLKELKAKVKSGELTEEEAKAIIHERRNAKGAKEWRLAKPNERGGVYLGRMKLQDRLDELKALEVGPAKVRHRPIVGKANMFSGKSGPISFLWDMLYSTPTTKLSLHPGWKDAYGKELARLLPYMNDEAVLHARAYLPDRILEHVDWASVDASRITLDARLTRQEADALASRRATDWARETFYDVVSDQKIHAWDVLRFISPFGEAWQDALVRWSRYMARNPMMARRVPQAIGAGEDIPVGWSEDKHLIDEDPTTGDLVIRLPMSGAMMTGMQRLPIFGGIEDPVSADITMPVKGLNMVLQSLPGFGPAVTMPLAKFMPNTVGWDEARQVVFPFGEPQTSGGILESLAPGWYQKIRTAWSMGTPQQTRTFMNDKANIALALMAEGDYHLEKESDQRKLEREAHKAAKALYTGRALLQILAPAPPDFNVYVTPDDTSARAKYQSEVNVLLMVEELRRYMAEDSENYVQRFVNDYGPDFYLLLQPKSYTQSYGMNATKAFGEWAKNNQGALDKYPAVAGLLGPGYDDPNNGMDFNEYNRQFATGERRNILTDGKSGFLDWIALAQNRFGQHQLDRYKRRIDQQDPNMPTSVRDDLIAAKKEEIVAKLPGFGNNAVLGRLRRVEKPRAIAQLTEMANSPEFGSMPGMDNIRYYLRQRRAVIDGLGQAGIRSSQGGIKALSTSDAARPWRQELLRIGDQLALGDPNFRRVWDELLSQEAGIYEADEESS